MFSVYITGGFTYIARDLIVRVFYSIGNAVTRARDASFAAHSQRGFEHFLVSSGDGVAPFRTSFLTVIFNGALNWLFACYFALGSQGTSGTCIAAHPRTPRFPTADGVEHVVCILLSPGIAISTVITNAISFLALMYALTRKVRKNTWRRHMACSVIFFIIFFISRFSFRDASPQKKRLSNHSPRATAGWRLRVSGISQTGS